MLGLMKRKSERLSGSFDTALSSFRRSLENDEKPRVSIEHFVKVVELLVWADKNDQRIVDFFIENNLLQHFTLLLERSAQRESRRESCITLIKLFSFLLINVKSPELTNFVYSHRVFNNFIKFPFNAFDEEIVVFYVNFLKSVAQKFEAFPLQIFYNRRHLDFPLYTQVTKFFAHPDSLVRATTFNTLLTLLKGTLSSDGSEPRGRAGARVSLQQLLLLLLQPPLPTASPRCRGGARAARLARGERHSLRVPPRVPQGAQ